MSRVDFSLTIMPPSIVPPLIVNEPLGAPKFTATPWTDLIVPPLIVAVDVEFKTPIAALSPVLSIVPPLTTRFALIISMP